VKLIALHDQEDIDAFEAETLDAPKKYSVAEFSSKSEARAYTDAFRTVAGDVRVPEYPKSIDTEAYKIGLKHADTTGNYAVIIRNDKPRLKKGPEFERLWSLLPNQSIGLHIAN
jgi:hypothetical protein